MPGWRPCVRFLLPRKTSSVSLPYTSAAPASASNGPHPAVRDGSSITSTRSLWPTTSTTSTLPSQPATRLTRIRSSTTPMRYMMPTGHRVCWKSSRPVAATTSLTASTNGWMAMHRPSATTARRSPTCSTIISLCSGRHGPTAMAHWCATRHTVLPPTCSTSTVP